MIRISNIHIEEFRGIRDLKLDLNNNNFGICGPNGTGKSGVVDAIEFCITGDITRLSGEGSGDISVKQHAPHVDQHEHPEHAKVTITATISALNKLVILHRNVKNPRKLSVTPDDEDVKNVIHELQTHPEFALSRREIVKYIITPAGKRSEDVQTLLRLEHIGKLRQSFTTFGNQCKSGAEEAESTRVRDETDLRIALKIDKLDRTLVLEKINEQREILKLPAIAELTKNTSFKEGLATPQEKQQRTTVNKTTALTDIAALQKTITENEPSDLVESRQAVKTVLNKLKADEKALALARQYGFIKTGLELITEDACPLCDTEWNADELRNYLQTKLLSIKEIENLTKVLRKNASVILQSLALRLHAIEHTIQYSQNLKPVIEQQELTDYITQLKEIELAINEVLKDNTKINPAIAAVSTSWWLLSATQQNKIKECQTAVKALPDKSAEDKAREILIVAQDRYEKLLKQSKVAKKKKQQSDIAKKVLKHYHETCIGVLEEIYDEVADDFSKYYRVINREDEEQFTSKLTSSPAKLSFDVDFFGRGLFPPGAYHSEGHQDGMGLCLYLALMKHTLGDKFTFTVLDDVMMSIDSGHRRDVCRLLKTEFPNTQFIVTTHDRVWLQYMKTENLISRSQLFGGWNVDSGPRVWNDNDIWTEIQNELENDEVPKAAQLLRRYLEYTATILADNLRANVEFRGDGQYDLSELLSLVLTEWKKKLLVGETSAVSWNRHEQQKALVAKRAQAKQLITNARVDDWAINKSVHFTEWANLQKHEFQDVANAFMELMEHLRCENQDCQSYLYCLPRKGKVEVMRCNCGSTNINLKSKN